MVLGHNRQSKPDCVEMGDRGFLSVFRMTGGNRVDEGTLENLTTIHLYVNSREVVINTQCARMAGC